MERTGRTDFLEVPGCVREGLGRWANNGILGCGDGLLRASMDDEMVLNGLLCAGWIDGEKGGFHQAREVEMGKVGGPVGGISA